MLDKRLRLRARRDQFEEVLQAVLAGEQATLVREEVLASWNRSRSRRSAQNPLPPNAEFEIDPQPLQDAMRVVGPDYVSELMENGVAIGVANERGQLVWTRSGRMLVRRSDEANFAPGAVWDEASIGVSAISLSLGTARPSTVWSTEHWSGLLHPMSCYGAPIRDFRSGRVLGAVNLTTRWDREYPLIGAVAVAMADRISAYLAERQGTPERDAGDLLPLSLRVLGPPAATLGGLPISLTMRQIEIILLLALRPEGIGLGELHADLYGDRDVTMGTLKAEISHLRRVLGGRVSRAPYRLVGDIAVDVLAVLDVLPRDVG